MTSYLPSEMEKRLQDARKAAGFEKAVQAARAFGWVQSTYAGHENGGRGFKMKTARKYAAAFGVSPEWLMFGTQSTPSTSATNAEPTGFNEKIAEYIPPTESIGHDLDRIARHIAPGARAITYLALPRAYPGLALLKGDVIVIDQNATTPPEGTLVVCQVVDTDTGEGSTLLKVFGKEGPFSAYGEPALGVSEEQSVIGSVIYSLRGAPGV